MSKQKVLPLKGLKSDKVRYYLYFCLNHDDFIEFVSRNTFQQKKYKFVMISLEIYEVPFTLEEIKNRWGLKRSKIGFSNEFMKKLGDKKDQYIDEIEFAYLMENGLPIPERLYPSSLKELASKQAERKKS